MQVSVHLTQGQYCGRVMNRNLLRYILMWLNFKVKWMESHRMKFLRIETSIIFYRN